MTESSEIKPESIARDVSSHFGLLMEFCGLRQELNRPGLKQLQNALQELGDLLNPENYNANSVQFLTRTVRDKEREKFALGADPGVHLQIKTHDGIEININAYGGLRRTAEIDRQQTTSTIAHGKSSQALSESTASERTQININILDANGEIRHDIWLGISSRLTPPSNKNLAIVVYNARALGNLNIENILPLRFNSATNVDSTHDVVKQMLSVRGK